VRGLDLGVGPRLSDGAGVLWGGGWREGRVDVSKRALVPCPSPGCPAYTKKGIRCPQHARLTIAVGDRNRGTAGYRGYSGVGWSLARKACMERDRQCQCDAVECDHVAFRCGTASVVADHFPLSRKQLIANRIVDPDDIAYLRGLCKLCHDRHTARSQPGGWNRR
jgi:5-methylcytosine-specific restriction protein A